MLQQNSAFDFPIRELALQEIECNSSLVHPVSCRIDPMRRFYSDVAPFKTSDADLALRLTNICHLLEWSHGYRGSTHGLQRATRRAASAGALYPTELFLLIRSQGQWLLLYYAYAEHNFFAADGQAHAARLAAALGLEAEEAVLLFTSVLWRTAQRYGVRGYRYCLLDAGNVLAHMLQVGGACGMLTDASLIDATVTAQNFLPLQFPEVLLFSLPLADARRTVPAPTLYDAPAQESELPVETPPRLSTGLQRILAFHQDTLSQQPRRIPVAPVDASLCSGPEVAAELADRRYSCRDFVGEPAADNGVYERVLAMARAYSADAGDAFLPISIYSLAINIEGVEGGTIEYLHNAERSGAGMASRIGDLDRAFSEGCQGQALVQRSAFGLILGFDKAQLPHDGHHRYRRSVARLGAYCAELYWLSAALGIGTTSIGGYSERMIADLLGTDAVLPVVIQIFGRSHPTADKIDAARIVGDRQPRCM